MDSSLTPQTTDAVILALDTSTALTRLVVGCAAEVRAQFEGELIGQRSAYLWSEIRNLLNRAHTHLNEINAIALTIGPGAFTGIRVGIAAAKGLAFAYRLGLIGITSLELAAVAAQSRNPVCALIGATRGEVYSQLFSFDEAGMPKARSVAMVATPQAAIEGLDPSQSHRLESGFSESSQGHLREPGDQQNRLDDCARAELNDLTFCGDGAVTYQEVISQLSQGRNWHIRSATPEVAVALLRLAQQRFQKGEAVSAGQLQAVYVRPAEAEVKLSQGLLGSKIKRLVHQQPLDMKTDV